MAHYARVLNGFVTHVIVADQAFIDSGAVGNPSEWIQTSYNTRGNIHYSPDGVPDGGVALRKNYAGPGYSYLPELDAFIPPKPIAINGIEWTLNETTGLWENTEIPNQPVPLSPNGDIIVVKPGTTIGPDGVVPPESIVTTTQVTVGG